MATTVTKPSNITLSRAVEDDVPALAEIQMKSYLTEAMTRFFFTDWPDPKDQLTYATFLLKSRFKIPRSETVKAINDASGEIVGFVNLIYLTGKEAQGKANFFLDERQTPGINQEFARKVLPGLRRLSGTMGAAKYFAISALFVARKYQRQGIGSLLMDYCLEKADEKKLPVYIVSFPGPDEFFNRFGFGYQDLFEVDLGKEGPNYQGFGVYGMYGMLREAQLGEDA